MDREAERRPVGPHAIWDSKPRYSTRARVSFTEIGGVRIRETVDRVRVSDRGWRWVVMYGLLGAALAGIALIALLTGPPDEPIALSLVFFGMAAPFLLAALYATSCYGAVSVPKGDGLLVWSERRGWRVHAVQRPLQDVALCRALVLVGGRRHVGVLLRSGALHMVLKHAPSPEEVERYIERLPAALRRLETDELVAVRVAELWPVVSDP